MLDRAQTPGCGCDDLRQGLMPLDAAIALALDKVQPVTDINSLPLHQCLGRVAAAPIHAPHAMPIFDNSAMDGVAVNTADCTTAHILPVSGTVAAGDAPARLAPATAMRIYTGAPIPEGADAVIMVEYCTVTDATVTFQKVPAAGDHIRRAGSDQPLGATLLQAGQRIGARHIGLLAANGITTCSVHRRVRIGVFSTGDELGNGALRPGQIHDANRPMLLALAAQVGAETVDLGVLPDDLALTTQALSDIHDRFDLVLSSGAVSVGGRDHIRTALLAAGGTLDGWRVAIKPGKPVAFGRLGQSVFTGLPGNPLAAFVGFHLFVTPQIARLSGTTPTRFAPQPACAGFDWSRKPGRAEVFPVRLVKRAPQGTAVLERLGAGGSATLFPLAKADGLAMVSADTDHVARGDALRWQPFSPTGEMR